MTEVGGRARPDGRADVGRELAPGLLRVRRGRPGPDQRRASGSASSRPVTRLVRQVQPRLVIPYAGPPCFLDDDLVRAQQRPASAAPGIFPDQAQALAWLRDRLPTQPAAYLLPGDSDRRSTGSTSSRDPHWDGFSLDSGPDERRRYLADYADRRRPAIDAAWAANPGAGGRRAWPTGSDDPLRIARDACRSTSWPGSGMTLRFEVDRAGRRDAGTPTSVRTGCASTSTARTGHADYRLRLDGRWLDGVVTGRTRLGGAPPVAAVLGRRRPGHLQRLPGRPAQARGPGGVARGRAVRGRAGSGGDHRDHRRRPAGSRSAGTARTRARTSPRPASSPTASCAASGTTSSST